LIQKMISQPVAFSENLPGMKANIPHPYQSGIWLMRSYRCFACPGLRVPNPGRAEWEVDSKSDVAKLKQCWNGGSQWTFAKLPVSRQQWDGWHGWQVAMEGAKACLKRFCGEPFCLRLGIYVLDISRQSPCSENLLSGALLLIF
jgi:hypothetical protein